MSNITIAPGGGVLADGVPTYIPTCSALSYADISAADAQSFDLTSSTYLQARAALPACLRAYLRSATAVPWLWRSPDLPLPSWPLRAASDALHRAGPGPRHPVRPRLHLLLPLVVSAGVLGWPSGAAPCSGRRWCWHCCWCRPLTALCSSRCSAGACSAAAGASCRATTRRTRSCSAAPSSPARPSARQTPAARCRGGSGGGRSLHFCGGRCWWPWRPRLRA